ncbi:MAG: ParB/RepB/Spo0J family partition protein [Spirochaetia bacterium]
MSKKALGKGINALFQEDSSGTETEKKLHEVLQLPINKIAANPEQPRKAFQEEALQELADSIREKGIIQPIIAEATESGKYLILAGERRYRAAQLAGLEAVPVIVKDISEKDRLEIALIENIQREDLTPIEEAMAYKHLVESSNLSQEEVAHHVGKKRSTITNSLRLLKLPQNMQQAIEDRKISAGHARAILSVKTEASQQQLFTRIVREGLSVRESERLAAAINSGPEKPAFESGDRAKQQLDPELQSFEQKLLDKLGTKISINGSLEKGKIEIHYFSGDDLQRIYELLIENSSS